MPQIAHSGLNVHALQRIIAFIAFAICMLCTVSPVFAERVEPPLELLYAPGNMLVAGTLVEINPAGRLVFQRERVLSGKPMPPEKIDVRVPPSILPTSKIGTRYIFGYSILGPDPRQPTRLIENRDGATMLVSTGLDPALFSDSRNTRALLEGGSTEHARASRRLFRMLLKALTGPDRALQELAGGQIALDPEIGEQLREYDGQAIVERSVRNPRTTPEARVALLIAAAARPHDFGDWWQPAAIELVTTTPVGGYPDRTSDPTNLVLTALELLDGHSVKVPSGALKRWLWNANPLLVEKASLMLRQASPALERSTIQQALADPKLPENTRKFLNDHLRRLDRLGTGASARKDGTD